MYQITDSAQMGREVNMQERKGLVTFKGNPLTLLGQGLEVGQQAPDVILIGNDLTEQRLGAYTGKVIIISAVPSLDTPVCDIQTRTFNQKARALGQDVLVLTVSMDLPFAQRRWCGSSGMDSVITLSDHRDAAFGLGYGVLIKELRLLARSVFVLDRAGIIRYIQVVPEITNEPEYDPVLNTAARILRHPGG